MLSPKNIIHLNPIELPEIEHSVYSITGLFDILDSVYSHMKQHIPIGTVTKYKIDNNKIHYRGTDIDIHTYKSEAQFKKLDIYGGISKKAEANTIVCRIMPVKYEGELKWVGIYLKAAYNDAEADDSLENEIVLED